MTTIISDDHTIPLTQTGASKIIIAIDLPPQSLLQLPIGSLISATTVVNSINGITKIDSIFGQLALKTSVIIPNNSFLELQLLRSKPQLQLILKKINGAEAQVRSQKKNINQIIKTEIQLKGVSEILPRNTINLEKKIIKLDTGAQINVVLLRPNSNKMKNKIPLLGQKSIINTETTMDPHLQAHSSSMIDAKQRKLFGKENLMLKGLTETFQELKKIGSKNLINTPIINKINKAGFLKKIQSVFENSKDKPATISNPLLSGTKLVLNFIGTKDDLLKNSKNLKAGHSIISAVVVATTPSGQPILNTPLGMMAVETQVPLKTGLSLQLEVDPGKITTPILSSSTTRFEAISQSKEWFNLLGAMHEISLVAPQVSQNLITNIIPQSNSQLTSNILFFLNALKGGDISSWIGNNAASLLTRIQPQLLAQLNEDFLVLGRANMDPQPSEWRTAIIPFFTTMGLDQFQLHTQTQSNQKKKQENSSRFIIDISLSRLGRLQLDGFLRKKRKRLDLIVRAQQKLPGEMHAEISSIYSNFLEASKISGQITFNVSQSFVEIPIPQLVDHKTRGVVI
jgi:hypothetical protein